MAFTIDFEPGQEHLRVVVGGPFDLRAAVESFPEALALCGERGLDRMLVDFSAVQDGVMLFERYMYVSRVAESHRAWLAAGGRPMKVAYLGPEGMDFAAGYGLELANDAGLAILATSDPEEALAWLETPFSTAAE